MDSIPSPKNKILSLSNILPRNGSEKQLNKLNVPKLSPESSPRKMSTPALKPLRKNRRGSSCTNLTKVYKTDSKSQLISHIKQNIMIPEEKKKNFQGSLYNLFFSPYFNLDLLIYYLFSRENAGIVDTLVNLINIRFMNQTFFYIPQIINLISSKKYSDSIEQFLLECCIDKIKFSLCAHWMVKNNIKKALNKEQRKKCESLNSTIEMTLVKTRRLLITDISNQNLKLYQYSINKGFLIRCFEENLKIYSVFEKLCDGLKKLDGQDKRDEQLRTVLKTFNKEIKRMYETSNEIKNMINTPTQNLFRGIVLPFDDSDSVDDQKNNLIVNFVHEHSSCFNTKARVPIKLVVECVRAYDCEDWDEKYKGTKEEDEKEIEDKIKKRSGSLRDEKNFLFNPFGENWDLLSKNLAKNSDFKLFKTHSIKCFIFKSNDDLSQEAMVMQLIRLFDKVFQAEGIPLQLKTYNIVVTSSTSGMIEYLPNTVSIDCLKKKILSDMDLNDFFRNYFCNNFEEAQKNFVESLAAYSLICYVLSVKDRHNGNILLDTHGNIIHIDFGFVLGSSPGGLNFESAPFKLTEEYIKIMDGVNSGMYIYFKSLFLRGLMAIRRHMDSFVTLVEIASKSVKMPCFNGKNTNEIIENLKTKFNLSLSEVEVIKLVDELIEKSKDNWFTTQYDKFQKLSNGILP